MSDPLRDSQCIGAHIRSDEESLEQKYSSVEVSVLFLGRKDDRAYGTVVRKCNMLVMLDITVLCREPGPSERRKTVVPLLQFANTLPSGWVRPKIFALSKPVDMRTGMRGLAL